VKIDSFEDLQRLLKLVDEHRLDGIEVDGVKVTKSPDSHTVRYVQASLVQPGQAGTGRRRDDETNIWEDPDLFPNLRKGAS
jgi:hypothetical protein